MFQIMACSFIQPRFLIIDGRLIQLLFIIIADGWSVIVLRLLFLTFALLFLTFALLFLAFALLFLTFALLFLAFELLFLLTQFFLLRFQTIGFNQSVPQFLIHRLVRINGQQILDMCFSLIQITGLYALCCKEI